MFLNVIFNKEKGNKLNMKKIIKILLIVIILVAVVNVCYRKYEESILNKEMEQLAHLDFVKDNFNTPIKTIGSYQALEKVIKLYLNDYSTKIKEVSTLINDNQLHGTLSAANYLNDGPEFLNTISYLSTTKEKINQKLTEVIELAKKETVLTYRKKAHLDSYYQKIYNQYMLESNFKDSIDEQVTKLNQASNNINFLVDQQLKVINFLKVNRSWTVKGEQIIFSKEEDLATYNHLISEIL